MDEKVNLTEKLSFRRTQRGAGGVTPESLRLRELARRIVEAVAPPTGAVAALLAGSAADGSADRLSDVDLILYYERLPGPAAFRQRLAGVGAEHLKPIGEPTEEFFVDAYRMDGVQVQTGGSAVTAVERRIDRCSPGPIQVSRARRW